MNLNELIAELLYSHDCVVIPGVGGFLLNYTPATIQPVQHLFHPPSRAVAFNAALQNNDGLLANSLANVMQISYSEAMEQVRTYAFDIHLRLQSAGRFQFENIGTLFADDAGNIRFEPEHGINLLPDAFGLPVFTSPAIIRGEYHAVSQPGRKDRRPERTARALPVATRWVLMLLPLLVVAAFVFLRPSTPVGLKSDKATLGLESLAGGAIPVANPGVLDSPPVPASSEISLVDADISTKPITSVEAQPEPVEIPVAQTESVNCETTSCYCIVAGCFADESNAKRWVEHLKEMGIDGFADGITGRGLRRVCAGRYSTYQEAEVALQRVREQVAPDAWLYKL